MREQPVVQSRGHNPLKRLLSISVLFDDLPFGKRRRVDPALVAAEPHKVDPMRALEIVARIRRIVQVIVERHHGMREETEKNS